MARVARARVGEEREGGRERGERERRRKYEPGNPPSTFRSQRTCRRGCGASARLWVLGVRVVVVEDVGLWLTRFDVVVVVLVEDGAVVVEVLGDGGRRLGGW